MGLRIFVSGAMLATLVAATATAQQPPPPIDPAMLMIWAADFEAPIASAEVIRVYNRRLIGANNSPEGVQFHTVTLGTDSIGNEAVQLSTEGLPSTFTLSCFETIPTTRRLIVIGTEAGRPAVYTSLLSPQAEPEGFVKLADFPEAILDRIDAVQVYDRHAVIMGEGIWEGQRFISGWGVNTSVEPDQMQWFPMPRAKQDRHGYTAFLTANWLMLAGGTDASGQPIGMVEKAEFQPPVIGPFREQMPAVPRRYGKITGTNHGQAMFLARQQPNELPKLPTTTTSIDLPTSQTILFSSDLGGNAATPWFEVPLHLTASVVRSMTIDPATSQIIILTENTGGDSVRLSAHQIPDRLMSRRRSMEELQLESWRGELVLPPSTAPEQVLQEAAQKKLFALIVVGSGNDREDVKIRVGMGGNAWRYMTINTVSTYLKGDAGRSVLEKHGIVQTPAYLLFNPEGELLASHTGSVPDQAQIFELTKATREPEFKEAAPAAVQIP